MMKTKTPHGISDRVIGKLAGCTGQAVTLFRNQVTDLPIGQWTPQQALGYAAYFKARRLGASRQAALTLWGMLENADLDQVREAVAAGCIYLRAIGDDCQPKLVAASVAFDATTLARLAKDHTPNAVINVEVLLDRLDRLTAKHREKQSCGS